MIGFAFTDEQEAYRAEPARYARTRLLPAHRARAASPEFRWDAHKEPAALGVLGIGLPERYGGTGSSPDDPVILDLATETLAYGDVNVHAMCAKGMAYLVADDTSESQKRIIAERVLAEVAR